MKNIFALAVALLLAACHDPSRSSGTASPLSENSSPPEQATKEAIEHFRLWARVFRGEDVPISKKSFSGRVDLDGDDVLIFDRSATGTLTFGYPVPVERSIIVVSPGGGMVIRCSTGTIPPRFLHAIAPMKAAFQVVNADPSLGRTPGESAGVWYSRILTALADAMERGSR